MTTSAGGAATLVSRRGSRRRARRALAGARQPHRTTGAIRPNDRPAGPPRRARSVMTWQRKGKMMTGPLTRRRSEEHTSELQPLMRISYAVVCLKKKKKEHKRDNYKVREK